jgi:hypothetical protein
MWVGYLALCWEASQGLPLWWGVISMCWNKQNENQRKGWRNGCHPRHPQPWVVLLSEFFSKVVHVIFLSTFRFRAISTVLVSSVINTALI